jgi:hypothetical protein
VVGSSTGTPKRYHPIMVHQNAALDVSAKMQLCTCYQRMSWYNGSSCLVLVTEWI